MKTRSTLLAVAGIVAVAIVAAWFRRDPPAIAEPSARASAVTVTQLKPRPPVPAPAVAVQLSDGDREFLKQLRQKFGARIHEQHAQIKLLEQLLAYLAAHGAAGDLARAYALLKALFPELADALFAKLQALIGYDEWLKQNRDALTRLSPDERRRLMWEARRELFGADADAIWAGELRAEELRASLARIDASGQLTTEEKLGEYVASIREAYGERSQDFLQRAQTELMNSFLDLRSVQEDLASKSPAERKQTLRAIRTGMGLDEAALERWDQLDAVRDEAWSTGQQYLLERDAILARYDGAEQAQRLRALQDRLFGAEADIIRDEEAAGFHRFAHRRRIGRE